MLPKVKVLIYASVAFDSGKDEPSRLRNTKKKRKVFELKKGD